MAVHAHGDEAAVAARMPQRVALLQRAQAELERGDATQALDDFERAAMMLHAGDAELGLIHAAMQDGQYRRALAFCAHTAGEHTDEAEGGALYAWLLRIGGQEALARQVLADTRAHAPDDAVARAVETAFTAAPPVAEAVLLQPLHRMAPWPVANEEHPPPPGTRFVSNGVLVDDGASALVPLRAFEGVPPARVWVRNGLGQTVAAELDRDDTVSAALGLAKLKLRTALPLGISRQAQGRPPFAGSPGYAMQFGPTSAPAWPMLTQGFLGRPVGDSTVRKVGFASTPGAPVFDAHGVLVGITLAAANDTATWTPLPAAAPTAQAASGASTARSLPGLVAPDEIYELGLHRALQVLVDSPR
jgi:hypothetical protein